MGLQDKVQAARPGGRAQTQNISKPKEVVTGDLSLYSNGLCVCRNFKFYSLRQTLLLLP